jgi:bacterioferritin (cytochrome b1)
MVAQLTAADHKEIAKGLLKAPTPEKAEVLLPTLPGCKLSKWSMKMVTALGNYGVHALMYKGLEVAVFWKRQTSEVIPDPSDPVPEGVLENPDDVWAVLYLNGKSSRQLVGSVADEIKSLQTDLANQYIQIEAFERIVDASSKSAQSKEIHRLQEELAQSGEAIKALKVELSASKAKLRIAKIK